MEFSLWLAIQEHDWNNRLNRRKNIEKLTGKAYEMKPFPAVINGGCVVVNNKTMPVKDTEEFRMKVEEEIWRESIGD